MRSVIIKRRGVERRINRDVWECERFIRPERQGGTETTETFSGRVQPAATSRRYFGSSHILEEHDASSARWFILTEHDEVRAKTGDEIIATSSITVGGETIELEHHLFVIKQDLYAYKTEILCEERV